MSQSITQTMCSDDTQPAISTQYIRLISHGGAPPSLPPPPPKNIPPPPPPPRVLARISKMPVQNSNFKIFARPDLATYLLQILLPATLNSLVCLKGQFTLQLCLRRWSVR